MTMAGTLRDKLDRLGLCPTAQGLEMAEREVDDLRAGVVEGLDYLTPGDLFTVYVIVADLSQAAQRAHEDTCQVAQLAELAGDTLTAAQIRAAVERGPVGCVGELCITADVVQ